MARSHVFRAMGQTRQFVPGHHHLHLTMHLPATCAAAADRAAAAQNSKPLNPKAPSRDGCGWCVPARRPRCGRRPATACDSTDLTSTLITPTLLLGAPARRPRCGRPPATARSSAWRPPGSGAWSPGCARSSSCTAAPAPRSAAEAVKLDWFTMSLKRVQAWESLSPTAEMARSAMLECEVRRTSDMQQSLAAYHLSPSTSHTSIALLLVLDQQFKPSQTLSPPSACTTLI